VPTVSPSYGHAAVGQDAGMAEPTAGDYQTPRPRSTLLSRTVIDPTRFLADTMVRIIDLAQSLVGDMRIDLGRSDGRMAEHGLHTPDIRAVSQ